MDVYLRKKADFQHRREVVHNSTNYISQQ